MFSFFNKIIFQRTILKCFALVFLTGALLFSCSDPEPDPVIVNAAQPSISIQSQGSTFDVGEDETFELTVIAISSDGGTLSYQWYSNTSNSNAGGSVMTGKTTATLTLNKTDYTTEDKNGKYYFYVVVTNTITDNGDGGKKTASRTSNFATVTVNGAGGVYRVFDAEEPVIDTQPAATTVWNVSTTDSINLTVTASVTDDGTLSYQWYSNSINSNTGGSVMTGKTTATLTLNKTDYGVGSYYFYVVVTNTIEDDGGEKTANKTSSVATVNVTVTVPTVNAQQPNITSQPATTNWDVSTTTSVNLTVTATSSDGGSISYQWYSNSSNSNTGGTAIGTNSATLSLAKANYTANGSYYFYVRVTNTNNSVTGTKTATATSTVATVNVTGNVSEVIIPAAIAGFWQTEFSTVAGYNYEPATSSFSYCDSFFVDAAAKKLYYYSSSALADGAYWTGTIVEVVAESGSEPTRLIVQLTAVEGTWWTKPEVNKYFALAYKNLAGGIVSMSQPYSSNLGAKNTGVDTKAEAISEYTAANGYYDYYGTYNKRAITPTALASMQGTWEDTWDMDWLVRIKGNTYLDFMDDYDDRDDIYTSGGADSLNVMGLIVDCTDTTADSGVLYILVLGSEYLYYNFQYAAVGWKPSEDEPGAIMFSLSSGSNTSLSALKTAYPTATVTDLENNYMLDFTKK